MLSPSHRSRIGLSGIRQTTLKSHKTKAEKGTQNFQESNKKYRPEHAPELLKQILDERGWTATDSNDFTLWHAHGLTADDGRWKPNRFTESEWRDCRAGQKINHFPGTSMLTRKVAQYVITNLICNSGLVVSDDSDDAIGVWRRV